MITFYDLAAKDPIKTASPNTWKTRYDTAALGTVTIPNIMLTLIRFVLNYKKLPYKTVYLEFPDIEPEFKKLGIPPSGAPGHPPYTCPSIIDHSNNTPMTDSYAIAEYLDAAYPDTPKVFPPGTEALQAAFYTQFIPIIYPVIPLLLPNVPSTLNPVSKEHFIRARSQIPGNLLIELKGEERVKAWKQVQAAFDTLHGWLNKSSGPYFMGDTVTFTDFVVGGWLYGMVLVLGENSEEWKDIMTWNDGRWAAFKKSLEPYADTDN
jgi:glutathione S-transferase